MGALAELNRGPKDVSQSTRAYRAIRQAIVTAQLLPGYPLLETDLAEKLQMSRTPVREAIQRLRSEGLVETVPRKGAFVKAVSKDDVRQVYEMAEGLEGMVAFLATQRADPGGLAALASHVEAMEAALAAGDVDRWITSDEAFHKTLHSLARNAYLVDALSRLYDHIHRIRVITTRMSSNKAQSTQEHRLTYEALRTGAADEARRLTHAHWQRVRAEVLSMLP